MGVRQEQSSFPGKKPSVVIAGGGIGGLATALQLHAIGITDIHVFEASPRFAMLGVGMNLMPQAMLVLRNLGLLDILLETGVEPREVNYYNRHGSPIVSEKPGREAGYLLPQISIHRGEFHAILLAAFKERIGVDRLHLDHCITSFTPNPTPSSPITAHFARRSNPSTPPKWPSCTADLLIAADGIHSSIRAQLYPDEGPPRFSGLMLWRATCERSPYLTGRSAIIIGHEDRKFIAYPISRPLQLRGSSLVNWVAVLRVRARDDPDRTPPKVDKSKKVSKERFAKEFSNWHFDFIDVPELIESTKVVIDFPMCDRDPVERWSFGKLTLLGDAAHAMLPMGSNGASSAILDAKELADQLLASPADLEMALKNYEQVRLPSTAYLVHLGRDLGPDLVMELAEERAPGGFENIRDVISEKELEEVRTRCRNASGFGIETVNTLAKETEGTAERLHLRSPKLCKS